MAVLQKLSPHDENIRRDTCGCRRLPGRQGRFGIADIPRIAAVEGQVEVPPREIEGGSRVRRIGTVRGAKLSELALHGIVRPNGQSL